MPPASILTTQLELAAVWLSAMGLVSGHAAFWTLFSGGTDAEVAAAAARGLAVGFAYGFGWTVLAAVALAVTES